jgi:hypothetical protein
VIEREREKRKELKRSKSYEFLYAILRELIKVIEQFILLPISKLNRFSFNLRD